MQHQTAMKILYNKSTLHRLPRAGVRWRWSDVIGDEDDGKVARSAGHVIRGLLNKHSDGTYSVTWRLAGYLRLKHGIELNGSATDSVQNTLPGTEGVECESRVMTDGSGATNGGRQLSLSGEDIQSKIDALDARDRIEDVLADDGDDDERDDEQGTQLTLAAWGADQSSLDDWVDVVASA